MKITVRIAVDVPEATGRYPTHIAWEHNENAGDNPAYYGHEVQVALEKAFEEATKGVQPYVVYRPDGGPERQQAPA